MMYKNMGKPREEAHFKIGIHVVMRKTIAIRRAPDFHTF